MSNELDQKILTAYEDFRESEGRPRKSIADVTQSITFAHFKAGFLAGYSKGHTDGLFYDCPEHIDALEAL